MSIYSQVSLAIMFVVFWSSGWVGSKVGVGLTDTFTFLAWRYALVVAILFAFVTLFGYWRRVRFADLLTHTSVGLLSHALFLSTGVGAIELGISAGMVAFVTAMQPMFTAFISAITTGERVSNRQWCGMTIGLTAMAMVIGDNIALGGIISGYILLLISVVSLTAATLLDRRLELKRRIRRRRSTPLPLILLIHSSSAMILFVIVGGYRSGLSVDFSPALVANLFYMAVIVSIGSYALMFLLLRHLSTVKVSSLAYLTPPTTMIMAWYLFGETVSLVGIFGLLLAAVAVVVIYSDGAVTHSTATAEPAATRARFEYRQLNSVRSYRKHSRQPLPIDFRKQYRATGLRRRSRSGLIARTLKFIVNRTRITL